MRRWWRAYWDAYTSETNVLVTASSGVLWVVCLGAAAALSGSASGAHIRLPFYEISATIIPVLLLAYFVEHAAMTRSIAKGNAMTPDLAHRRQGERLLATGRALAALLAASAATGEILALYAVAYGRTSTFLFVGTVVALVFVGMAILLFAVARIGQPPRW
jgi:uncharacterized membrane protein